MKALLDGLNPAQKKAVTTTQGPLLIVAGAGTGKTRTLTHRIAYLIEKGVPPQAILSVTFTNKAAKEMKERVQALLDSRFDETSPTMRTFHSLGVLLLRKFGGFRGWNKSFSILDRDDQKRMVKDIMKELGIDPKEHDPNIIRAIISRSKNELVTPDSFNPGKSVHARFVPQIWKRYAQLCKERQTMDFDDLLYETYMILKNKDDVREQCLARWKYIHVDEYQDTNTVQYEIIRLLVGPKSNICVVGDGDQNIYSWRGANVRNILHFEEDYPNTTTVLLEENYRSSSTILHAAQAIIEKNNNRVEKVLEPTKPEGETIVLLRAFSETDEAHQIATSITNLLEDGVQPSDIAILYRTNFQSRVLEESMLRHSIPYQVVGTKFFDRKEIKDVVAYLICAQNPANLASLARIINTPKRGIGKVSQARIFAGQELELSAKAHASWKYLQDVLAGIQDAMTSMRPSEVVSYVLKESGLEKAFLEGSSDDRERLANARELVTYATKYDDQPICEGMESMLEDISLLSDQDTMEERPEGVVRLMTIHAAKGLEFPHVFITGLEQGLFPSDVGDPNDRDPEEERRLCYVAFTRAEERLYVSYAQYRTVYGQQSMQVPSEFLADIPEHLIEGADDDGAFDDDVETVYLDW